MDTHYTDDVYIRYTVPECIMRRHDILSRAMLDDEILLTVADVPEPSASSDSNIRPGMKVIAGTLASIMRVLML
mgnify:CR=1 FL=1